MKSRASHHANLHHAGHHLSKSKPVLSANYQDPAFSSDPSTHPLYASDHNDRWTTPPGPPPTPIPVANRRRHNRKREANSIDFIQNFPAQKPPFPLHDTSPQSSISSGSTVVSTSDETRVPEDFSLSQGSIEVPPTEDTGSAHKPPIGKSKGIAALFHRRKQPMTASQDTIAAPKLPKETLPPLHEPSPEGSHFTTQRQGSERLPMPRPLFENFPAQPGSPRHLRLALDRIDELDETNPLGLYLHHGGPYEAIYKVTGKLPRRTDLDGKGGSRGGNSQRHSQHTRRNLHPHERSFNVSPGEIFPSESGFSRFFHADRAVKERQLHRDYQVLQTESHSRPHFQPLHDAGPRSNQVPRNDTHKETRPPEGSFFHAPDHVEPASDPVGDTDDPDDDFYLPENKLHHDTMGRIQAPTSALPTLQSHRDSLNMYTPPPASPPPILTFHPDAGASREELYEPPSRPTPLVSPNGPSSFQDRRETRMKRSQPSRPMQLPYTPNVHVLPSHAGSVASSYRSLSSKSSTVPSVLSRSTQSGMTGPPPSYLPKRLVMPAPLQPSVASSRSSARSSRLPAQAHTIRDRPPLHNAVPRPPPYYGSSLNRPQVIPIGPNGPNRLRKRSEAVFVGVPRTAPPVPSVPIVTSNSLFAHVGANHHANHLPVAAMNRSLPSYHVKADKSGKKVLAKRRTGP